MNSKLSCLVLAVFLSLSPICKNAIADTISTNVIQDGGVLTTSDGSLIVGNDDVNNPAVLTLKNGAEATVTSGFTVGANGVINAPDSQTSNHFGIVEILSGSKLNTGYVATLGFTSQSNVGTAFGEATVSDPDSVWSSMGGIIVGFGGSGRLTIANGGVVSSPAFQLGFAQVYNYGISVHTATVTGQGSKLLSNDLRLSPNPFSTAKLTISDEASVEVNGKLSNDSKGVVNVDNGSLDAQTIDNKGTINLNDGTITTESLTNTGKLEINGGTFSTNSLIMATDSIVLNDGKLVVNGGLIQTGNGSTYTKFTINGNSATANPTLELNQTPQTEYFDSFTIGKNSNGHLILTDTFMISGAMDLGTEIGGHGAVDIDGGTVNVWYGLNIGSASSSNGVVNIKNGANVGTGFIVGDQGTGTLNILSGSVVSSGSPNPPFSQTAAVIIANSVGSEGDVTVDGENTKWKTGGIEVGREGIGTLRIQNGAHVTSASAYIGGSPNYTSSASITPGNGNVLVTGENSTWNITSSLGVGYIEGKLEVINGARVICDSGSVIATSNEAVATTIVSGETSRLTALHGFLVGSSEVDIANLAFKPLDGNATVVVEKGAQLISQGTLSGFPYLNGLSVLHGGTLTGSGGFIFGNVNDWGGTISPGSSPGIMTIEGNLSQTISQIYRPYIQGVSHLQIELAGRDQGISYDFLHVTGTTTLDGLLNLSLLDGFEHSILSTDSFTILTSDGGLTGGFTNVGSNHRLETEWGSFHVTYDSHSVVLSDFVAVPETSSLLLTGLGVCGAIAVAVRKP